MTSVVRLRRRVDEGPDLFPGLLVQIGALVAQPMNAAMDVGIMLLVDVDQRLDHLPRPLGGGRVVEIDQRHVAVQPRGQDGKIGPQRVGVERRCRRALDSAGGTRRGGRCGRRSWHGLRGWPWLAGLRARRCERGIDRRLQHPPGQQAAFLPVGRKPGPEQLEHVFGREPLHVLDRLAVELFDQHRSGRLADAAAVAVEIDLLEPALPVDLQFQPDHVAAQGVRVLMRVRALRTPPAMVRLLVVFLDAFLVQFFFASGMAQNGEAGGEGDRRRPAGATQV